MFVHLQNLPDLKSNPKSWLNLAFNFVQDCRLILLSIFTPGVSNLEVELTILWHDSVSFALTLHNQNDIKVTY